MACHYLCQHLTLPELRAKPENRHHRYLFTNVPAYPRPELHVSHLSHRTSLEGLRGVRRDSGFRDPGYRRERFRVVWFSLTVSRAELREAEGRSVIVVYPDGTEESITLTQQSLQDQQDGAARRADQEEFFLKSFASSSAFQPTSRLGSFCFTFSLQDVLNKYSQQFCEGQRPVMRVWKTTFYSVKVEYVVLVHSPTDSHRFSEFPLLQDEAGSICAFREEPSPHFIWRPQAMCGTHSFELLVNHEENVLSVEPRRDDRCRFYVWDCVALTLHVSDRVLQFGDMELRGSLRFCEKGDPRKPGVVFQEFEEAQAEVQHLWPLELFYSSQFNVTH